MLTSRILLHFLLLSAAGRSLLGAEIPEFRKSAWFGEQVRELRFAEGIRVLVNAPSNSDSMKPTRLVFYATPNGNTLEQTMGSVTERPAAAKHEILNSKSQVDVESWRDAKTLNISSTQGKTIELAAHSGGGSFLFGFFDAGKKWIQPAPSLPERPADALGGRAFFKTLDKLAREEREEAIANEIIRGNFPEFLRSFKLIKLTGEDGSGKQLCATLEVMPDYLAIGSDADFVRAPMNPRTACRIAQAFGCSLPTRKIVDVIHANAGVKLEPRPLTQAREAIATFVQHHQIIEEQRKGLKLGELVSGIKKDLVLSNRLEEKPNRVAIYGWHRADGKPIQPLNVSHVSWYVDYSHGARLIKRQVEIDGKLRDLGLLLISETWSRLLSDEGPIRRIDY